MIGLSRNIMMAVLFSGVSIASTVGWNHSALGHSENTPISQHLKKPKFQSLLEELEVKHGFDRKELEILFGQAKFYPEIPEKFEKPAESLSYDQYKPLFIKPEIVKKGRDYLDRNKFLFKRIEQEFGVDAPVIAAILGVETKFGDRTHGGFLVFDALNSTFIGVPNRESFARKEIIHFLLLCREENLDPLQVKGSYAGAMGIPQFISSSYRSYTVDFDKDGKRDLWNSEEDILASVANYLKVHGWQHQAPIKQSVLADPESPAVQNLLQKGIGGKTSVKSLHQMGVSWVSPVDGMVQDVEVSLLSYPSEEGETIAVAFPNFRSILTYNRAVNYALVVADLADLISNHP